MSTLSSSSTLAEIKASYDDNASYEEDDSVSKANAFVTAGRMLIRRLPARASKDAEEIEMDVNLIRQDVQDARHWLAAHPHAGGSVIHANFQDFRE